MIQPTWKKSPADATRLCRWWRRLPELQLRAGTSRRQINETSTTFRRDSSSPQTATVAKPLAARRSQESGFAFLMALGMIFIALALSLVILENFVTDGKRTREAETIWRGEQYERAVRLYYHKMGRYPQTIDDLKKGGLNLHFLRQEYKNPMNKTDGTWRFIYVNAAGPNHRQHALQQSAANGPDRSVCRPDSGSGDRPGL